MQKRFVIRGTPMLDGFRQSGLQKMFVVIEDGLAYDEDFFDRYAQPLRMTLDGELSDSARGGFLPENGEVERVEAILGYKVFARPSHASPS